MGSVGIYSLVIALSLASSVGGLLPRVRGLGAEIVAGGLL
jgi:hypothetical protein